MKVYKSDRSETAWHEAGHAINFALSDIDVAAILVNTNGKRDINIHIPDFAKGVAFINPANFALGTLIKNNELDRTMYTDCYNKFDKVGQDWLIQQIRSYTCGVLAGHIAECIFTKKSSLTISGSDNKLAKELCNYLPGGEIELKALVKDTYFALKELYPNLKKLAEHVGQKGMVHFPKDKYAQKLLPKPFSIKIWQKYRPSSPVIHTEQIKNLALMCD